LDINLKFIEAIIKILGIKTKIICSSDLDYDRKLTKTDRLIAILKELNATSYLSGPSAKNYIDESLFKKENIELEWMDYSGYMEYPQLYPPFVHEVSIIDLILNTGPNAPYYMNHLKLEKEMTFKIPFNKPCYTGNEDKYVLDSMRSLHISGNGPYTKKCEEWFETD